MKAICIRTSVKIEGNFRAYRRFSRNPYYRNYSLLAESPYNDWL